MLKRTVSIVGMILLVVVITWKYSNSRTSQLFGELIDRVDTNEKVVALTFDDGPTKEFTPEILATLDENNVKATFFLTGSEIDRNPDIGRLIVDAGHAIGNHSYTHKRMIFKSPSEVKSEIDQTTKAIRSIGYDGEIFFRPPYGKKLYFLPRYLESKGITSVTWDVQAEKGEDIAAYAIENVKPGSIILLHVMYKSRQSSREAVPVIVKNLKDQGYRFLTVPELIGMPSKKQVD